MGLINVIQDMIQEMQGRNQHDDENCNGKAFLIVKKLVCVTVSPEFKTTRWLSLDLPLFLSDIVN